MAKPKISPPQSPEQPRPPVSPDEGGESQPEEPVVPDVPEEPVVPDTPEEPEKPGKPVVVPVGILRTDGGEVTVVPKPIKEIVPMGEVEHLLIDPNKGRIVKIIATRGREYTPHYDD